MAAVLEITWCIDHHLNNYMPGAGLRQILYDVLEGMAIPKAPYWRLMKKKRSLRY